MLCLLTSAIFYITAANTANATTYYVDPNGSDSAAGDSAHPWKTVARALPNYTGSGTKVIGGDTVKFRTGNYGAFSLTNYSNTNWIIYTKDTGATPVFTGINITNATKRDIYLKFDGINITQPNPNLDPNLPPWPKTIAVDVEYGNYFDICNCTIKGWNRYLTGQAFESYDSDYATVENCEIYDTGSGVRFIAGNHTTLKSCNMHDFAASAVDTHGDITVTNFLIERNHIHSQKDFYDGNDPQSIYFPPDRLDLDLTTYPYNGGVPPGALANLIPGEQVWCSGRAAGNGSDFVAKGILMRTPYWSTSLSPHHWVLYFRKITGTQTWAYVYDTNSPYGLIGFAECIGQTSGAHFTPYDWGEGMHGGSALAIRSRNVTIKKNIIHNWGGQGIYFYPDASGYSGMTIENNLVYDVYNSNAFTSLNGTCLIRNNTLIGFISTTAQGADGVVDRYRNAGGPTLLAGYDGTGVEMYNNVFVGGPPLPLDPNKYVENYNIYSYGIGRGGAETLQGANSKITVWKGTALQGYPLRGWPNYFENINYTYAGGRTGINMFVSGFPPPYDYDYARDGIQAFFVSPGFKTNISTTGIANGYNTDTGKTWDYHLAAGSPGINFGNQANQPTDSLGTIGSDGFIVDDGPARDSSHHSAGCYEYVSGIQTYTLNITASYGTVAKSPNKTSYTSGETATLQATPNTGYHFVSWSGDASGTSDSTTITMTSNKSVTANFAINTYTLSITASNGLVAKSPNKSSYDYGEIVTLTATANYGYSFSSWSGDASGTSSTTTVTMNSNKSVTANFSTLTYSLTINSSNGSVTKTPEKTVYNYGEQVVLQAVADTGYHFTGWSGGASGTANPVTITMTANKTVTASFAINTYTLATSAAFGSVTKSPSKALYDYGETVTLQAVPNTNYAFTGWSGDASGSTNPVSLTMNASKSVSANFVYTIPDNNAPSIDKSRCYPRPDAIQVPLRTLIILYLTDVGTGVDGNTVSIDVNGENVYTGNVSSFSSTQGRCHRIGNISRFIFIYQPYLDFDYDQTVTIAVDANDLSGNKMNDSYSFTTEMLSFGKNEKVDSGSSSIADGHTATAADSGGNIWAVWQKGATGSRDIYIGKLTADAAAFGTSAQLTNDSYDQCNPAIAVDSSDKIYAVWQDNRRGYWDVFCSTSTDGATWSSAVRITDSNSNHINPEIAIDHSSPNKVYVVWQDDQNVNQDIFVASSTNSFSTKTITQVTSNTSDQTKPAVVVDAANTAYIFWTDLRNGTKDIYGAASNSGPWTNVAVVTGADDQSEPAVAAESTGAALHLLWVDVNSSGNEDIYYSACSGGLHALTGKDIIDDTTHADQNQPAITVRGSAAGNLDIYACWRDKRNTDTDLYLVQIGQGSGTNVFVGDDSSTSAQSGPAIGVDADGYPYIVWVDGRDTAAAIYYAGATHIKTDPLLEQDVLIASNTTVGTDPSAISSINDISVFFPADSYLCDVNLTCSEVENPPKFEMSILSSPYEFGPSGIDFEQPVTIVIPYIAGSGSASVYWYNTLTAQASQTGITNIQDTTIFGSLHAISFKTTHFTWYFVGSSSSTSSSGGGGGGGGCSLAPPGKSGGVIEFFLPFLAMGLVMAIIKWQDRRNLKRSDSKTDRI